MSNCKTEEKLLNLILGDITKSEAGKLHSHVDQCASCKTLYSELKVGVKHFQKRFADLPDMPKRLSEKRFNEIIATARELESEQPNIWPDTDTPDDASVLLAPMSWVRTASWGLVAGLAIAIGLTLVVKRPWEDTQEGQQNLVDTPPKQNEPDWAAQHEKQKETYGVDRSVDERKFTLKSEARPKTSDSDSINNVLGEPKTPDTSKTPDVIVEKTVPNKETVNELIVKKSEIREDAVIRPLKIETGTKETEPTVVVAEKIPAVPKKVDPVRRTIMLHEVARNQLPRYLNTTPKRPSSAGLQFTPTGHVMKVSQRDAAQYAKNSASTANGRTVKDERSLYRLSYKADERSAKKLIDLNEQMLLAGGLAARNVRYKPRSSELEIIGNRQELMALHQAQSFLCSTESAVNLTLPAIEAKTRKAERKKDTPDVWYQGRQMTGNSTAAAEIAVPSISSNNGSGSSRKPIMTIPKVERRQPLPTVVNNDISQHNAANSVEKAPVRTQISDSMFGGEDPSLITKLQRTRITKRLRYKKMAFGDVIKRLLKRSDTPLIDLSDQSKTKLSLDIDEITIYQALIDLCETIDVKVLFSKKGVVLVPYPNKETMQTVIFRVDNLGLRVNLRKAKSVKEYLMDRGIEFPKGAGVSSTRRHKLLIIHNSEANLEKTSRALNLKKWE